MDIMTNKDMIKSILDDTDRLVDFLNEPTCRHCNYCDCDYCNCGTEEVCMDGINKWLESEADKNA